MILLLKKLIELKKIKNKKKKCKYGKKDQPRIIVSYWVTNKKLKYYKTVKS